MPFCRNCGAEVNENAAICVRCGAWVNENANNSNNENNNQENNQRWLVVLLLCFFLGYLGVHRFYVGKTGTGVVQLLTCGGCGIWLLIDFIMILVGSFTDADGNKIKSHF